MLGAGLLPGMEVASCAAASFGKNACSALASILITKAQAALMPQAVLVRASRAVAGSQHAEHSSTRGTVACRDDNYTAANERGIAGNTRFVCIVSLHGRHSRKAGAWH